MTNQPTLWIDVTDLIGWSGSFTGIQRVLYEYAKRLDVQGAKFFAYDKETKTLKQVLLDEILAKEPLVISEVSKTRAIKAGIQDRYDDLPESFRAFLNPYKFAAVHTVRTGIHAVKVPFKNLSQEKDSGKNVSSVLFGDSDKVLFIGATWNNPEVFEMILEQKQLQPGITILQHINDLLPIYQPQLFDAGLSESFTSYIEIAAEHLSAITVISEATKRDVKAYYKDAGISLPSISVIRLGDNIEYEGVSTKPAVQIPKEFILAVGTFEVRKNYTVLYQALKLAQIEKRELPKIVIVGRPGWLSGDIRHQIETDPFTRENIVWIQSASDGELRWLYEKCMFTVFPSIAEGWGLPVAESLQYGKFCLVSGTSAMLEIGNGLVDYFLPYDPRECMEKIHYYVFNKRYDSANSKALKEYEAYDWDQSYAAFSKAFL